jgi:uncharacterized protein (TIGR02452 family)
MEEGMRMRLDREYATQLGYETVAIVEAGGYRTPSGRTVTLRDAVVRAKAGTVTYPPEREIPPSVLPPRQTQVVVTNETTLEAARRLVAAGHRPVALNYASAHYPGGGFLSGARAQEESLARSSALYACLKDNPMYAWHQAHRDPFYTDYAIYSPDVPVIREDGGALLEEPYLCAFITCPAVNATDALDRDPTCGPAIRDAMASRVARVLAIAAAHGHADVILGAWGCGAFGNDPRAIAALFHAALSGPYRDVFALVVFAIPEWSSGRGNAGPFKQVFRAGQ